MKKALFIFSLCFNGLLFGQFSESFFETLHPSGKPGHYYGTATQNAALGVCFADSLDTEVQWAKVDLNGNFQTFSANLPTDYISPNERIIEVFESGTNQFIVSQDSASSNNEGIRIYKYENYTQSAGVFELPVQLRNAYFQAYFKFGKIYVFYVESGVGLRMLKVNPATLQMEENMLLGDFPYPTQISMYHFKRTHVMFEDENNMQVFSTSAQDLIRIKVVNNVPQTLESWADLNIIKILGVNHSTDKLICQISAGTYNMRKFHLAFDQPLNQMTLTDSLTMQGSGFPNHYWRYANNDADKEFFAFQGILKLVTNNVVTESIVDVYSLIYSNLSFLNDQPLLFGTRIINSYVLTDAPSPLIMSWGNVTDLMRFKEYSGIYDFGPYKLRTGIGNILMGTSESNSAQGDFIFDRLIYSSSLMIAGKSQGMYYGITPDYMSNVFKPGPYTNPAVYDQQTVHRFHENFYVDKEMVHYHVAAIANNASDYVIPLGILHWPAHGDTDKGQAEFLAPFIDVNANNIYEPQLGEYPSFPGTRCLLNITHQHESDALNQGLGVEMHNYIYNFDCEDTLQDVVLYKTEIFNRSSRDLDSLGAGVYSDFDMGGYNDDYVGTHVNNGLVYAYNGDNVDEGQGGMMGFNDSLPSIGNLFLKGVKFADNTQDDQSGVLPGQTVNGYGFGDGVTDNEYKGLEFSHYFTGAGAPSSQSDPSSAQQIFNYLNGKWRFGADLVYGGTGYPGSANATTLLNRYSFPGDTDPMHYGTYGIDPGFLWDEQSSNNPAGDRRMVGSFGVTPLAASEKVEYHFAYLAGKRVPGWGQSQIDLFAKADHVQRAFHNNETSCGQTFGNLTSNEIISVTEQKKTVGMKLYPNPVNEQLTISVGQKGQFEFEISDINGKTILQGSLQKENTVLDVSGLEKGIYFVKVSSTKGIETLKFVKN